METKKQFDVKFTYQVKRKAVNEILPKDSVYKRQVTVEAENPEEARRYIIKQLSGYHHPFEIVGLNFSHVRKQVGKTRELNIVGNKEAMQIIYKDTLTDLKAAIENKFGTLSALSVEAGIDRHNLSRLFSDTNPREMSIGTFVKICTSLGLIRASSVSPEMHRSKISLKQYLEIDNNAVMKNILLIRFM